MTSSEDDYIPGQNPFCDPKHMVVVSGCSGGGKSTLLSEMARRGYAVMPEPGRQIVREEEFIGGDGVPWKNMAKFLELCISRAAYFHNTAVPERGYVLFDRSIIDAVAAAERLGVAMPDSFRLAAERYRYAPVIFMVPPWPELFAGDAERQHSFDAALAEYEHLLTAYPEWGYRTEILPKLGISARADHLEACLANGL